VQIQDPALCQKLVNQHGELTYELAVDGTLRAVSVGWYTLLGYAPGSLLQQPLGDFLAPGNADALSVMLTELCTTAHEGHCAEWQWSHRDGTTRWFIVTHVTVQDEGSNVVYIAGHAHNVTAYKQQIADLQEQVTFHDSVMNALPDPVFIKDEQHRMILVNEAHCRMVGLSAAEILATAQVDPTPKDELALFWAQDALALNSNQPLENEETLTDSRGCRHTISTRKVAHQLPNGQKILLGTVRDITERRQVEERLQHEQALLRRLLDAIPDLIFYKNKENVYAGCNRAFEVLTGLPEQELIGKRAAAIFPNAVKDRYDQEDYAVLHEQATIRTEQWVTYPDGRTALLDTLLTPFLALSGESLGLLGISRDITERKAVEEELRAAKEAAESAYQMKTLFLSTMTHELRTPMNGVLGLSGLLLDTELNAAQLDLVNTIRASGDTLLALINDILDFSKIEANKLTLEFVNFDLRSSLEHALDLVAAQATAKDLTLAYFIEPMLPFCIEQDETRLRQILTNLLSNAVKFSDSGEIVVTVEGQALPDGCWELHFAVCDQGIGIPAECLPQLFQPFTQVDVSTSRRYGGTGLGLAISRRLVELMGGTMWIESEVGQGSTFHFSLRATKSKEQRTSWLVDTLTLSGRHILVIEEGAAMQRLLTQQLTAWGVNVTVQTQLDGAKLARQTAGFDALILDANLLVDDATPSRNKRASHQPQLAQLYHHCPQLPIVLLAQLGGRLALPEKPPHLATVAKPIHASQLHDALVTVISGRPVPLRRSGHSYVVDNQMAERHPLRILLAEDNIINQKVVVGILANHGYRVDVAANGLEVLDALNRQPYELILMDINMPDLDGFMTTNIIRSSWLPAAQPHIIALTANALHGDNQRCLDAGMNDYVSKPIQVSALIESLQRVPVRNAHPLAQAAVSTTTPEAVAPVPAHGDAVDITVLLDIIEILGADGSATACELITIFLDSSPPLFAHLAEAIAMADTTAAAQLLHKLRSPAGQLGALRLAQLCADMESICSTDLLGEGARLFRTILDEYARVRSALHQLSSTLCGAAGYQGQLLVG
jgi:PAS domain S-box-containing protein